MGQVGRPVKLALDGYSGGGETSGVRFDWNARRATANRRKLGVSFAASVFLDSLSASGDDPDHSLDERRFVTSHVQDDEVIRITARLPTRVERRLYEEG